MRSCVLLIVFMHIFFSYATSRWTHKTTQAKPSDVKFYFYSAADPSKGILTDITNPEDVAKTKFSNKKDTFFIVHGWLDKEVSVSCQSIKDAYLKVRDCNVFIIDWDSIADSWLYPYAASQVKPIGEIIAEFIKKFDDNNSVNLTTTTIVGHSLGAHIAGVIGRLLNTEIGTIIGLDPAGPLFMESLLTQSSAHFVQVIHTCGSILGYFNPVGHADYYPNGGKIQPMCLMDLFGKCSHLKAIDFFAESILTGNFKAKNCDSYNDFKAGKCENGHISLMGGYDIDKKAKGKYFLETNLKSPYGKN